MRNWSCRWKDNEEQRQSLCHMACVYLQYRKKWWQQWKVIKEAADDRIIEGRGGKESTRSCRSSSMDDRLDRDAASISSANRLKSSHQTATRLVSKPVLSHFSGFFHSAEVVQSEKKRSYKPSLCCMLFYHRSCTMWRSCCAKNWCRWWHTILELLSYPDKTHADLHLPPFIALNPIWPHLLPRLLSISLATLGFCYCCLVTIVTEFSMSWSNNRCLNGGAV